MHAGHSPDLGVAHETVRESDSETVSVERDMVVLLGDGVHGRRVGVEDGVALLDVRDSPAYEQTEEKSKLS